MYCAGVAGEGRDVARHLLGREGHELADDVERALRQRAIGRGVVHVADDRRHPGGQTGIGAAAIEDAHLVPGSNGKLNRRERNLAGAADEENVESHEKLPLRRVGKGAARAVPTFVVVKACTANRIW